MAETQHTSRMFRLTDILGDPKKNKLPLISMSKAQWHRHVKSGVFPKPFKHGNSSFWTDEDVRHIQDILKQNGRSNAA